MQPAGQRGSPYQGLIPYTEADASYFFGREQETRLIVANLFASPLTLLYGPSGVGKSSVLRAGVVSELNRRQNLNVVVHTDWKNAALDRLKGLLFSASGLDGQLDAKLPLGDLLQSLADRTNHRWMILLDQFEEYFLYHPKEDDFMLEFSHAVTQPGLPASFLISIREDALAKLDRFEGRIPILFDNYLRLDHLDDTGARAAIERPIAVFNGRNEPNTSPVQIEPKLVDEVLRQLKTGQLSLERRLPGRAVPSEITVKIETPYLQLVINRIWSKEMSAHSRILRLSTLESLGGAEKIVRTHLDRVMKRLSSDYQSLAAQIFQYLVTPSGTKIALSPSDLASYVDAPVPIVRSMLKRLSDQDVRLLRTVDSSDTAEPSYEIFHDVLAAPILDWRQRRQGWQNLQKRATMLVLSLVFLIAVVIGALWLLSTDGTTSSNMMLTCILPLIIIALFIGVIGFFTGITWERTK
jgi:hypothetical protein